MSETTSTVRRNGRAHWLVFSLIVAVAYVVVFAVKGSPASAFGYVMVPAVIGWLIIRHGVARGSLLMPRYGIFILLIGFLVWQNANGRIKDTAEWITEGCMNGNDSAIALNDGERRTYCQCFGEKMAFPTVRKLALAALAFAEPTAFQEDPVIMSTAAEAVAACSARLSGS